MARTNGHVAKDTAASPNGHSTNGHTPNGHSANGQAPNGHGPIPNMRRAFSNLQRSAPSRYAHIVGWGMDVPELIITNADLEAVVETTDEWIRTRTGIHERRFANDRETVTTLGFEAARKALDRADMLPSEIDLIIVATSTPENFYPSTAARIQNMIGATHAGAFDLSAACAGFVYAVNMAAQAIRSGSIDKALVIGSEGMLAVAFEVTVKLLPKPQVARCIMASFADVRHAGNAVAAIIAAGIIPAGLEMMDKPMTAAVEGFVHAGYDLDAAAILLCESDGTPAEVEHEMLRMAAVLQASGATRIEASESEAHRLRFWSGRKNAFPASGRISPDYMCMDSTIPRKRLADMLIAIGEMETKHGLRCVNVFHAGDGNLHPLILFDANEPDQLHRAEAFGAEILEVSIRMGGTVTGEHGVGVEKLSSMCVQFSPAERAQMFAIKAAFDPAGGLNPGKVIPSLARCAEYGRMHVKRGLLAFPELPRF